MIKCVFFLGWTTSWMIDNVQLIQYDRFFATGSDAVQGGRGSACRITCSSPLAIRGGGLANDWRRLWCDVSLGARIMEILTYFSSHSRQVNVATWFLVLPIDKENPYWLSRGWYLYYIYMSSSWHHILAISPAEKIEIYRVGDNRGTV